jgi:signal transduction histidine kinase
MLNPFTVGRLLIFDHKQEVHYQAYRHQKLINVFPLLSYSTAAALIFFALSDYLFLPDDMAVLSASLRLLVNLSLVIACFIAVYFNSRPRLVELLLSLTYFSCGLVTIYVIYLTEQANFRRPREGFAIILLCGYFLLQLPLRVTVSLCALLSLIYISMLYSLALLNLDLVYAVFYVFSFNLFGYAGAFMQDRSRRQLFLKEQQLIARNEKDRLNIEKRKQLVAIASHDLRQPLQGITLLTDIWISKSDNTDHAVAHKIKRGLDHVNRLLNSLFSLSHIETGAIETNSETISLRDCVNDIFIEERERFSELDINVALNCPEEITINTDPVLFGRMLRNIIHNTIDHSGATELQIEIRPARKSHVFLYLSDNGCGVDPIQLPALKSKYKKGDTQTTTGLGVGLFIVEEIANQLGLAMRIKTQRGAGFNYRFELPTINELPKRPAPTLTPNITPGGKLGGRLLLIESDNTILNALCDQFRYWGFTVEAYNDAMELLALSSLTSFDFIVTDYNFDTYHGIDLINHVRAHTRADTPALVLTADTTFTTQLAARATRQGPAVGVCYKPITSQALYLVIKTMCKPSP